MKIGTFRSKCSTCGVAFSYPSLSDFSYGSFLFAGEKGGVYAYFSGLDNPVWDFMKSVLVKKGSGRQADLNYGERIQAACAYFADPIKGQQLCNRHVCPRCQSSQIDLWPSESTGVIEIPEASHLDFMSLPDSIRRQKVLDFDRGT